MVLATEATLSGGGPHFCGPVKNSKREVLELQLHAFELEEASRDHLVQFLQDTDKENERLRSFSNAWNGGETGT